MGDLSGETPSPASVRSAEGPLLGRGRLQQIDVLKGLAALSVVATHTLSVEKLVSYWAVLHIWQAVPLFVVILGANSSLSFDRRTGRGQAVLTWEYFSGRAARLLLPFAFVWGLAWIVARERADFRFGIESWVLQLPYPGPGNYYVPLVVILVVMAPVLYVAYRRWPVVTLVLLLAADVAFELAAVSLPVFTERPFLYSVAFPRYLAAFALGFLIADRRLSRRVLFAVLGVGACASLLYLYVGNRGLWSPPFLPTWRTQNALAVFYPALLAALGMRYLPSDSESSTFVGLGWLGKASYHIYLFQMVFFMVAVRSKTTLMIVVTVALCAVGGLGFYFADDWTRRRFARSRGRKGAPGLPDPMEG